MQANRCVADRLPVQVKDDGVAGGEVVSVGCQRRQVGELSLKAAPFRRGETALSNRSGRRPAEQIGAAGRARDAVASAAGSPRRGAASSARPGAAAGDRARRPGGRSDVSAGRALGRRARGARGRGTCGSRLRLGCAWRGPARATSRHPREQEGNAAATQEPLVVLAPRPAPPSRASSPAPKAQSKVDTEHPTEKWGREPKSGSAPNAGAVPGSARACRLQPFQAAGEGLPIRLRGQSRVGLHLTPALRKLLPEDVRILERRTITTSSPLLNRPGWRPSDTR